MGSAKVKVDLTQHPGSARAASVTSIPGERLAFFGGAFRGADDDTASRSAYVLYLSEPACGPGQTGTPPNCVDPPSTCPQGKIGTPPNCVVRPNRTPALGRLTVSPKSKTVRRGKKVVFKLTVKNTGKAAATRVKACGVGPKSLVKVSRCVVIGSVGAGKSKLAKFTVSVVRKAKKGRKAGVIFSVTAMGVAKRTVKVKIKVKR